MSYRRIQSQSSETKDEGKEGYQGTCQENNSKQKENNSQQKEGPDLIERYKAAFVLSGLVIKKNDLQLIVSTRGFVRPSVGSSVHPSVIRQLNV